MIQQKKNKWLSIVFVSLVFITGLYYYFSNNSVVEIDPTLFKVEDWQSIDKIILQSSEDNIQLNYNGLHWMVNDTREADPNLIDVLFATLQQAKPKRAVSEKLKDSIVNALVENGIKVSLYQGKELKREFMAGGNIQKTTSFFLDLENQQPYLVTIPGYRVYTSGVFELPEKGWWNKRIFSFNWRNFSKLSTDFPESPNKNFDIQMDKNGSLSVKNIIKPDTARLNDYLDFVSLLQVDEFLPNNPDSIKEITPILEIKVWDIGGNEFQLTGYQYNDSGDLVGAVDHKYPFLLRKTKAAGLLRDINYFKEK